MDKFEESEQAINFYPANYTDQTEKAGVFPIAIQVSFERTLRGESLSYSGKREDEPLIVFWVFVKQDYIENCSRSRPPAPRTGFTWPMRKGTGSPRRIRLS